MMSRDSSFLVFELCPLDGNRSSSRGNESAERLLEARLMQHIQQNLLLDLGHNVLESSVVIPALIVY